MKIEKKVVDELYRAYCVGQVTVDGVTRVVFASEAEGGNCYAYYGDDFEHREVIWEKVGGTMSFVEIPHTNGEFLIIKNFFPGFNSKNAKIMHGRYAEGKWVLEEFISLPYVHRFDLLESDDKLYFIGATLCTSKRERNDWGDPGKIWVGEMPNDLHDGMTLHPLRDWMLKNHGYSRSEENGRQIGLVTADSGIYKIYPPDRGEDWRVEQILAGQISDAYEYDLDGDGAKELVTISPFHGNELCIRKKDGTRRYETTYTYEHQMDFAHAIWAGELCGEPTVVYGIRRENKELGYIRYNKATKQYESHIIEKGVGPANVCVLHQTDRDVIVAANNGIHEAAVYWVDRTDA
jgi:hypothetical protein